MSFKQFLKENTISDMQRMKETLVAVSARPDRTAAAFDKLIAALEAGQIYNVVYKESMMTLNYDFEKAFDKLNSAQIEPFRAYRDANNVPWNFFHPRLAAAPTAIKQIEKYMKEHKIPDHFFVQRLEFLKIFAAFKDANDLLKKNTIAGRVPNPNAVPKFTPTYAPQDAMVVQKKFKEICADLRNNQIKSYVAYYKKLVEAYLEKVKDIPVTSLASFRNPRSHYTIYPKNPSLNSTLRSFIDSDAGYVAYKDVETRYIKQAEKSVDFLHDGFISKNVGKLSSLIAKMPLTEIATIRLSAQVYNIEAELLFKFENGASFYVINKAVFVENASGKQFLRFPTTFHDVVNSDGTKMKSPSEEKMNLEWK